MWNVNGKNEDLLPKLWFYSWGFPPLYTRGGIPWRVQVHPSATNNHLFWRLSKSCLYRSPTAHVPQSWWRHKMETSSALLALCAGNPPTTGEFPSQRPVKRNFDVFFNLHLNKHLSKQFWSWWYEMPSRSWWRHCNYADNDPLLPLMFNQDLRSHVASLGHNGY